MSAINLRAAHVFADRDELHLGRDDAVVGVPFLGDGIARGAQRLAALGGEAGELDELVGALRLRGKLGVLLRQVAVVLRLHFAAIVVLDIARFENPLAAQRGKAFFGGACESRIAPRAGAIIDADRIVFLDAAIERLRVATARSPASAHAPPGGFRLGRKRGLMRAIARGIRRVCSLRWFLLG